MLIRKPTTIVLKPEDDMQEYDEYKQKQEMAKKGASQIPGVRTGLVGQPLRNTPFATNAMQTSNPF
jgi:hypothetical protein